MCCKGPKIRVCASICRVYIIGKTKGKANNMSLTFLNKTGKYKNTHKKSLKLDNKSKNPLSLEIKARQAQIKPTKQNHKKTMHYKLQDQIHKSKVPHYFF
jgi:hypothetical protein